MKNIGYTIPGFDGYIFEKSVKKDIVKYSFEEYMYFLATQKEPKDSEKLNILRDWYISTGYTDLRIWPNRIAVYAAQNKTELNSSLAASLSSNQSEIYGQLSLIRCAEMLIRSEQFNSLENFLEKEINKNKYIYGFGRPNAPNDERVIAFIERNPIEKNNSYYLKKLLEIEKILMKKNIKMNYAAIGAAICLDLKMEVDEIENLVSLCLLRPTASVFNYIKKMEKDPLDSDKINLIYEGDYKIGRKWKDD